MFGSLTLVSKVHWAAMQVVRLSFANKLHILVSRESKVRAWLSPSLFLAHVWLLECCLYGSLWGDAGAFRKFICFMHQVRKSNWGFELVWSRTIGGWARKKNIFVFAVVLSCWDGFCQSCREWERNINEHMFDSLILVSRGHWESTCCAFAGVATGRL